jgi:hypothetical protein
LDAAEFQQSITQMEGDLCAFCLRMAARGLIEVEQALT